MTMSRRGIAAHVVPGNAALATRLPLIRAEVVGLVSPARPVQSDLLRYSARVFLLVSSC